ncbi:Cbf1 [Kluyveromyces lactis]|nr:Cbf1 [Kluyveromyces lactis]
MSGKRSYQDDQLDVEEANKRHQMVDTLLRGSEDKDGDNDNSVYDDLLQDPEEVEKENKEKRDDDKVGDDEHDVAKKGEREGQAAEQGSADQNDENINVDVDPSVTAVARAAQHASQRREAGDEDEDEDEDEEEEDDHVDIDDVDKDPDAVIDEDDDEEDEDQAQRRRGKKNIEGTGESNDSERATKIGESGSSNETAGADGSGDREDGSQPDGTEHDDEENGGAGAGGAAPRRGRKPGTETGSTAWKQQRKESHKEVERRRRQNINTAIEKLSDLLPVKETSKAAILSRAAEYIQKMKETETANIEKWTLQKLLGEQQVSSLTSANDKLEQELSKAYKNLEELKKKLKEAGIEDPTEEE